jgi:CRP-like cAMP-binding protein
MIDPALLDALPVFARCSPEERDQLALAAVVSDHEEGDILFSVGDARDHFILLLEGDVRLSSPFFGREQTLVIYHAPNFLSIRSLLGVALPHANTAAVVSKRARIARISGSAFASMNREHQTILGHILSAATIALEERITHANRKLFALYTVGRLVRAERRMRVVAPEILHVAATTTKAQRGLFVVRDAISGVLTPMAMIGYSTTSAINAWRGRFEGDGLIGAVCATRQSRVMNDYVPSRASPPYASNSMLLAPLLVGATSMGAILLADRQENKPFGGNSVLITEAIAQQVADAFERGRLSFEREAEGELKRTYVAPYTGF